jgi:hypothetical protein
VNGSLIGGSIIGVSQSLSINSHKLPIGYFEHCSNPTEERLFKFLRVDYRENPRESVMGGNTVWKLKESLEPALFGFTKACDLHPVVGSANNPTNGYDNDVYKLVVWF